MSRTVMPSACMEWVTRTSLWPEHTAVTVNSQPCAREAFAARLRSNGVPGDHSREERPSVEVNGIPLGLQRKNACRYHGITLENGLIVRCQRALVGGVTAFTSLRLKRIFSTRRSTRHLDLCTLVLPSSIQMFE